MVEDITTVTDLKIRPDTTTDTTVRPDITTVGSGAELTDLAQRDITDSLLGLGNPEAERGLEAQLLLGRNPSHLHRPPLLPRHCQGRLHCRPGSAHGLQSSSP